MKYTGHKHVPHAINTHNAYMHLHTRTHAHHEPTLSTREIDFLPRDDFAAAPLHFYAIQINIHTQCILILRKLCNFITTLEAILQRIYCIAKKPNECFERAKKKQKKNHARISKNECAQCSDEITASVYYM